MADAGKVAAFPKYMKLIRLPSCPSSTVAERIAILAGLLSEGVPSSPILEDSLTLLDAAFDALTSQAGALDEMTFLEQADRLIARAKRTRKAAREKTKARLGLDIITRIEKILGSQRPIPAKETRTKRSR